jgi:hypothetical protein
MLRNSVFCTISSYRYQNYYIRRGKWTEHVASMKHRRCLYIIFEENTDVRKLGKWIFIKSDRRLWNQFSRFRTEPAVRSFEHIINRIFLHNAQNFLIDSETINFSLKILLYGSIYICGQVQRDNNVNLSWVLTLAWLEYHTRQSANYLNRSHTHISTPTNLSAYKVPFIRPNTAYRYSTIVFHYTL